MSHLINLQAFIHSKGFDFEPDFSGKFQRFDRNGKISNGWAKSSLIDLDGKKIPCVVFGDWATGEKYQYQGEEILNLSPADIDAFNAAMEASAKEEKEARRKEREETAKLAQELWGKAVTEGLKDHPYVVEKKIQPYGARLLPIRLGPSQILVPMYRGSGELVTLQRIGANQQKRFLKGGEKRAAFTPLGMANHGNEVQHGGALTRPIFICEGWATGCSLHEATGNIVICAMDAGNLEPVAEAIRLRYPKSLIFIAADNDRYTPGNPGVTKATEAAQKIGAQVLVPELPEAEGTDFNDLHAQIGIKELKRVIQESVDALLETRRNLIQEVRSTRTAAAENPIYPHTENVWNTGAPPIEEKDATQNPDSELRAASMDEEEVFRCKRHPGFLVGADR